MRPVPGRYNTDGPWLKGNTHIHSVYSDGGRQYADIVRLYAERGYDFIFLTDHMHVADIEGMPDPPLLALNGVELDGSDGQGGYYHATALGFSGDLPRGRGFPALVAAVKEAGAIVICAHPYWTGNSIDDVLRHPFDGVEVYNDICGFLNGKAWSSYHWDRMLEADPLALGLSADDAHLNGHEPLDRGWIMVHAEPSKQAVIDAIRRGDFYATQGPAFHGIHVDEGGIRVTTDPVRIIRLAGGRRPYAGWGDRVWQGTGDPVTEAEFAVPQEHDYVRVEIEDEYGRRAWTNSLLIPRN
jgi:hypothetical protein